MNDFSVHKRIQEFSLMNTEDVLKKFNTISDGYTRKQVELQRSAYGSNKGNDRKTESTFSMLKRAFISPFTIVLFILAVISLFTDIIFCEASERKYMTVITVFLMLIISGVIRLTEEIKSRKVSEELVKIIHSKVHVLRNGQWVELSNGNLVVGDYVKLRAGERVPADIRIIKSDDCYISESVITGESNIQRKNSLPLSHTPLKIQSYSNIAFFGTTVASGTLEGVVATVGKDTVYGDCSHLRENKKNGYLKGADSIAWVLIKFMAILIPVVFIASGFTKDWVSAFIFALSVAVGLMPELLPMVITACLAKGSYGMERKKTFIKNINAMQGFGSMDVLCVDKTGTLTGSKVILEYYTDILGNENQSVLDYAYINSYFHCGPDNHIDNAILRYKAMSENNSHFDLITSLCTKVSEVPFDYDRRISSVLVNMNGQNVLISKGNVDEIVKRCRYIEYKGEIIPIEDNGYKSAHAIVDEMQDNGMKVIAISKKIVTDGVAEERDMILTGYIAFFDAPKKTASEALKKLSALNVKVKVLTGDCKTVAVSVCKRLKINTDRVMTGEEFDRLTDNEAQIEVENTDIFAELTPKQKGAIIALLQSNGHTVGYMGDGVNDIPAMMSADVAISVDTAVTSVKEIADVILLQKDLGVLEEGIIEGRKSFANMTKYIKITASSNLGNIIAIVIASIFLPFFPMTSVQLLLLNLLYDIMCLILPWDNVDSDMCEKPLEWSGKNLSKFMLIFGPISSVFDVITFLFLMLYMCPAMCGGQFAELNYEMQQQFISLFHTGWFLESMWTQVLILYLLRTKKLPLIQSRPSDAVLSVTLTGIILFTILAVTPIGSFIGMTSLPLVYFGFLILTVICYLLVVTVVKKFYIKKNKSLI